MNPVAVIDNLMKVIPVYVALICQTLQFMVVLLTDSQEFL